MKIIKISNLTKLLTDDTEFNRITSENPWGFILECGKSSFNVRPDPQFGESFRKYQWSFKLIG